MAKTTKCLDCKNATGGCSWSEKLEPIKGWKAEARPEGYFVNSCPQFVRDSYGGGLYRTADEYIKSLIASNEHRATEIRLLTNRVKRLSQIVKDISAIIEKNSSFLEGRKKDDKRADETPEAE